jgi:phenylalanyl-tRNA synthetase beta chain
VNLSFKYEALHAVYHPYQSANIYLNDKKVGHYGTLHPSLLSSYDLKDVYALTLYIDDIYGYQRLKTYEVMSKFPSVTRDLSFVMDRDMALEKPIEIIKQTLKAYLEEVTVFDVYKGEHIDNTKMSVAFRMVLNDPKQTLESDEVDKLMKKVMHRLSFELHMEVRS